ncbi:MAG TPA: hypothetical protein PK771_05990 [Spirochaetota bacterium]|nr:hypothetical protein [Spirochaetota bacterium]
MEVYKMPKEILDYIGKENLKLDLAKLNFIEYLIDNLKNEALQRQELLANNFNYTLSSKVIEVANKIKEIIGELK